MLRPRGGKQPHLIKSGQEDKMERRQIVVRTAGVVLMAGALFAGARLGRGSDASADSAGQFNCTNATLEGRYAVIGSGFIPGGAPPAPLVPSVHMSLMTLDGAGNLTDRVTVSDNGHVHREVAQGTYSISSDCKGRLTIPVPGPPLQLTWDLVVAELQGAAQGKEFYGISTVPRVASTFTAKRIQ
jgi:hypothetical protein